MEEGQGLEYWVRWQVPVSALAFLLPAAIAFPLLLSREKKSSLKLIDLWIPCWRSFHPVYLLFYRAIVLCITSSILTYLLVRRGFLEFYFYTQWTFALLIVYFALGFAISARGCWLYSNRGIDNEERGAFLRADLEECTTIVTYRSNKSTDTIKLQSLYEREERARRAGFWGYLMQIVHQTCAGAVILTDIVFWFIIVPFLSDEHFRLNLLMGCMHSLNALFLLLDTMLNSLSFPWFRMAYFVLWSCLYVIFLWVLHACGFTWWPYPFLELATAWAPLWYFSLALIHVPCYGLYALIVRGKQTIFSKFFPHAWHEGVKADRNESPPCAPMPAAQDVAQRCKRT